MEIEKSQQGSQKWWEDRGGFFGLGYLEADDSFDGFLSDNKELGGRTEEEVQGVMRLTGLQNGDQLMDCPCGYGRHSLGLATKGINVTGVDINSEFLSICGYQKLSRKIRNVEFVRSSMLEVQFREKFDALINMFYSFGFFSEAENQRVAQNFYNALKPGGKFLMHTHVTIPRFEKKLIKEREIRKLKSGNTLELTRYLDQKSSREIGKWTVVEPTGVKKELTEYSVRIYSTEDYEKLCRSVGFSKVEFFADWQGKPYFDEADLLIAVATK